MKDRERAQVLGAPWREAHETRVALDALAVYVQTASPIQSLTIPQIRGIFRGQITNWNQVGGPDHEIILYSRENNSGTYAYFKEHVLEEMDFAANVQTLPGTAAVINAISRDPYGIGYGGIAYAEGVRAIRVAAEGGEPVEPNLANATSGATRSARFLYVYTAGAPRGLAADFIAFVTPEGAARGREAGFYPLPARRCECEPAASPEGAAPRPQSTRATASPRTDRTRAARSTGPHLHMRPEVGDRRGPERDGAPSRRAVRRSGRACARPSEHRLGEALAIHVMALAAVLAIALIFLIIARRRCRSSSSPWPHQEEIGGLDGARLRAQWPGYDEPAYVWQPVGDVPKLNLVPLFVGTLKVTVLAMLIAVPLSVGAAIYVSQYASRRARELLKPRSSCSRRSLRGARLLRAHRPRDRRPGRSRDDLPPQRLRGGSASRSRSFRSSSPSRRRPQRGAQGARARRARARRTQAPGRAARVVPAALPGIAAAVILGVGRAIGETMIVLMASGQRRGRRALRSDDERAHHHGDASRPSSARSPRATRTGASSSSSARCSSSFTFVLNRVGRARHRAPPPPLQRRCS
jgi:hypothetical protein